MFVKPNEITKPLWDWGPKIGRQNIVKFLAPSREDPSPCFRYKLYRKNDLCDKCNVLEGGVVNRPHLLWRLWTWNFKMWKCETLRIYFQVVPEIFRELGQVSETHGDSQIRGQDSPQTISSNSKYWIRGTNLHKYLQGKGNPEVISIWPIPIVCIVEGAYLEWKGLKVSWDSL